jgi:hypothetical protein
VLGPAQAELFAGLPGLVVEDVLLQQADDGLHRVIAGTGSDSGHGVPGPGVPQG